MKDRYLILIIIAIIFVSCSTMDCGLNSLVQTNYKLAGIVDTLNDTLTVSTNKSDGNDSVIYNKVVGIDSLIIPMSYQNDEDVFYFEIKHKSSTSFVQTFTDEVRIKKTNVPHFESIDCASTFFHEITEISYTRNAIDSIVIKRKDVNYDITRPHFYIYFKHL